MKRMLLAVAQVSLLAGVLVVFGCKKQAQAAPKDPKSLYKIHHKAVSLKVGTKGNANFAIKLVSGAKIHPKAPFVCQVSATKGVKVEKKTLGHPDTSSSRHKKTKLMTVQVKAPISGTKKGGQKVKMDCAFFVCTKDICMRTTEKVTVATNVK